MKFKYIALVVLFVLALEINGQERIDSELGLSIEKPKKWISVEKLTLNRSVKALALPTEKIAKILDSGKNSVLVFAFSKRAPTEESGPIPTIQVRLRKNTVENFQDFMPAFISSVGPDRSPFEKYEFVGEPAEVQISGLSAVFVRSKYLIRGSDGIVAETRARIYAIPSGEHFFQITMIDFPKIDDCSSEFDSVLKSIVIAKPNK